MLSWAWQASRLIDRQLKVRVKFVLAALARPALARRLSNPAENSPFARLLEQRPQTVGALIWPFQCAAWTPEERFDRIAAHADAVADVAGLDLATDAKLQLLDLSFVSPGVSLILDRPTWLAREGLLTMSLFKDDFRAFTLSFSLMGTPPAELFIGGLQGRQTEDVLTLYRELTKDFAGVRPRDLMLEALRMFAIKLGVMKVYAVADTYKVSRHAYFGKHDTPGLFYDAVWEERGDTRAAPTYFELPVSSTRRSVEDVPAKKRSMYRRRYEMFDIMLNALPSDLSAAPILRFDAK